MSAPNTRAISLQTLQGHQPSEDFVTRLRACGSAVGGSIVIDMGADCGKAIWGEYVALRQPAPPTPAIFDKRTRVPTFQQAKTALRAMRDGVKVSLEVMNDRMAICDQCEFQGRDAKGTFCRLCGCGISRDLKAILNLASYEEELPMWGCKIIGRGKVRADGTMIGWPRPDKCDGGCSCRA